MDKNMQRVYGGTQPIHVSSEERQVHPRMTRGEIHVVDNKRRARKTQNYSNAARK